MATVYQHRARLANAIRHHPDDREAIDVARRDLAAAQLAAEHERLRARAAELAGQAPPLTADQRARLGVLLNGPGDGTA